MEAASTPADFLSSIAMNSREVLFRYRLQPAPGFDYLNDAIAYQTGYPRSSFIEHPSFLATLIHPQDRASYEQILTQPADGTAVVRLICRDGRVRPFSVSYVHIMTPERELIAIEGIMHRLQEVPGEPLALPEEAGETRIRFLSERLKTAVNISLGLAQTLDTGELFNMLVDSIESLFPDLRMVTIARFHDPEQQFECVAARIDGVTLDPSLFPRVPLEPPGKGTQSEAVHTRRPVIIADLQTQLKKASKVVMVDSADHEEGTAPQSALCVPMLSNGLVLGVVQMQSVLRDRFSQEDAEMLSIVANTAAVAMQNGMLMNHLNNVQEEIQGAYDATLDGLSRALEIRDQETEGHTRRVVELARKFGRLLKLPSRQMRDLWHGAILHDVGKIGVPDAILNKPGPLSPEEWVIMRKHAEYGCRILRDVEFLQNALVVLRCHHEKWDGSGYPDGLAGEEIPLSARIFALVDVYDALTSDRPYRKAWSQLQALDYIRTQAGKHFDPALVEGFITLVEQSQAVKVFV